MKHKTLALMVTTALIAAPVAATAQGVTYDFTAEVAGGGGPTFSGTMTFNLANATSVAGTIGDQVNAWSASTAAGDPLMFSATVTGSNGVSYSTQPGAAATVGSAGATGGTEYGASESATIGNVNFGFALNLSGNGTFAFNTQGLPIFNPGVTGADIFFGHAVNESPLQNGPYSLTSLTPVSQGVPEPASLALMILGLGGVAFRRRLGQALRNT